MRTTQDTIEICLQSEKTADLVRQLYQLRKKENRKFSLQYLCHRIGGSSKGYLGDVMKGRRRLRISLSQKLAEAFGLEGLEKKVFLLMARRDAELSKQRRAPLDRRLAALKGQLNLGLKNVPAAVASPVLFTRVFCSLGFFSEAPNQNEILALFKKENPEAIRQVLRQLVECGALIDDKGRLRLGTAEIIFGNGGREASNLRYIAQCMAHAQNRLAEWYPKSDKSYFESSIVSVRKSQYESLLPRIRDFFDNIQSELEVQNNADGLIHFNIQIFPDPL